MTTRRGPLPPNREAIVDDLLSFPGKVASDPWRGRALPSGGGPASSVEARFGKEAPSAHESQVGERKRAWVAIARELARSLPAAAGFEDRMRAVVEAIWEHLHPLGVSWVGFYLPAPGGTELVLGPRRDKPACSPIGLHGVCGGAFRERRAVVVTDVRALGENCVACDPADRSDLVVPLPGPGGEPRAVLDLDSREVGLFRLEDVRGLEAVLAAAFPSP